MPQIAALYSFQFSTIQPVTYFLFDFDRFCGILHELIRACISDSLAAFSVAIPFKIINFFSVAT